jgi:hypothetical protein
MAPSPWKWAAQFRHCRDRSSRVASSTESMSTTACAPRAHQAWKSSPRPEQREIAADWPADFVHRRLGGGQHWAAAGLRLDDRPAEAFGKAGEQQQPRRRIHGLEPGSSSRAQRPPARAAEPSSVALRDTPCAYHPAATRTLASLPVGNVPHNADHTSNIFIPLVVTNIPIGCH